MNNSKTYREIVSANHAAYSRIAGLWEEKWGEEQEKFHRPCREILLQHMKGNRILDIGCGLGRDSLYFASKGFEVTATDIVADFLPPVKNRDNSIKVAVMDMTRPSFAGGSFDAVYSFASFLHIPHELSLETLAGFRAMLKPEGLLFINHLQSRKGFVSYQVDDLLIENNPAFCYCHDTQKLQELVINSGFKNSLVFHVDQKQKSSKVRKKYQLEPYQILAFA